VSNYLYRRELHIAAHGFIVDLLREDGFLAEMLETENLFDIERVDSRWHESVVDTAVSLSDAAEIFSSAEDVESDKGLWEGQDVEDAFTTAASFTFSGEARGVAEQIYSDLRDRLLDRINEAGEFSESGTPLENETRKDGTEANLIISLEDGTKVFEINDGAFDLTAVEVHLGERVVRFPADDIREGRLDAADGFHPAVKAALDSFKETEEAEEAVKAAKAAVARAHLKAELAAATSDLLLPDTTPVAQGSNEEERLLLLWLQKGRGRTRGGYPLGHSYIDARCGNGLGMPEELDYVRLDHEVSARCPHLSGKYRPEIVKYFDEVHMGRRFSGVQSAQDIAEMLAKLGDEQAHPEVFLALASRAKSILAPKPKGP
jgi:hypothetical protein